MADHTMILLKLISLLLTFHCLKLGYMFRSEIYGAKISSMNGLVWQTDSKVDFNYTQHLDFHPLCNSFVCGQDL